MTSQELLVKLRTAYRQWNDTKGQSIEGWMDMLADDVKLRSVADGAEGMKFSAPRDGKAAAREYFSALNEEWEMIHHSAEEFIIDADGERVAVFGHCAFRNRKTDKTAETHFAHRWRFRGGQIVEFFEIYDTAKAFAAAHPDPA